MVNDRGMPFKSALDPCYESNNKAALKRSIDQLNEGQVMTKSREEFEVIVQ